MVGYRVKTLLVISVVLLFGIAGCAKPETQSNISKQGCNDLQLRYDTLQFNYDSLKRASEGNIDANERYNAQVNELQVLKVEKAVREAQIESLTAQYNAAVNALSGKQVDSLKALEQMNEQLNIAREQSNEINAQVKNVRDKKVSLLSDNLTDVEYASFYKGWELWWGTFNEVEEDEEESEE